MSNYWRKKLEELNAESSNSSNSSKNYWQNKMDELDEANKKKSALVEDIAPVKTPTTEAEDERTWFQKGLFEDGYQFGDVAKTIFATGNDAISDLYAGITNVVEGTIDAGAYIAGGIGGLFGADEFQSKMQEFVAKDIINEDNIGHFLADVNGGFVGKAIFGMDSEDVENASVLGDKTDSLVQSGGQLLTTAALQSVGVPWWLTSGVTSFGGEAENAFNQGATYLEAGGSALITAGAEVIFEKLSGGIKFGGKTLDDVLLGPLTNRISSDLWRTVANVSGDVVGEGLEEVFSQAASNLGSALYREEDLGEIMGSQEAWDGYLESFIGGAALGGASDGFKLPSSIKTGRDIKTGLTTNEQKVLDKVYEDRLAEAEKDGTKLTGREKSKIYDEVLDDLQKGAISTDTIEGVLGGETYKTYQDTINNEDAILREFEELGDVQNPTLKQQARYTELAEKVKEIEGKSQRNSLKAQLSEEVQNQLTRQTKFGTQADNYLIESYNEKARRSQTFQADLSKYDKSQQETIKKAVESGILNNTRRTREFVEMVAKISADKGVLFDFTNNAKLKETGFAVEGATVNGYYDKATKTVGINTDSSKAYNSVVGHEITHVLKDTDLYGELQNAAFEYAKSKGEYDSRREALAKLYAEESIDEEMTADLVGDYLFTDSDFINNLSTKHRNVFQKVYDEIKYLYKVATAGSKEARDLERVKRAFDQAYKADSKANTDTNASADTKHSLSDSDGKQLTKEQGEYFKDSKMRDDNGNLKVMYHGSQDAGFHEFNSDFSDDDRSFFFVDRNDVAATYSGTYETYEAKAFRSVEDANNFFSEIGKTEYEVVEENGEYKLLDDGDEVATSGDLSEIYQEFCDYEGVGYGDANYKVYLNLTNPLEIDAKGSEWSDVPLSGETLKGINESWDNPDPYGYIHEATTRQIAEYAKAQGYDGVIFKNIVDNGGYSNGSEGASTVAIAFESNQIKSVANEKPTGKADIRYSLSEDSEGRELSAEQRDYFKGSKVVDGNGNLKVMYHGTPNGDFSVFKDGTYFTENKWYADLYQNPGASSISTGKVAKNPKTFEVYLDIKKPFDINDTEARNVYINDYIKGGNAVGINPYLSDAEYRKINSIDWTEGEDLREFLIDNGYDYDGLVLDEGAVGGYGDDVKYRGKSFVVFSPDQVKSVDNKTPTSNPDIRFSLSVETDKNYLNAVNKGDTETARKIVEDVAEQSGYTIRAYHGTPNTEFTVFDKERLGKGNDQYGAGFYFATSKEAASHYGKRVIDSALNIKKPIRFTNTGDSGNNLIDADITLTSRQAYEVVKRLPNIYDAEESPLGDYFDAYWEVGAKDWMIRELAEQYRDVGYLDSDLFRNYPNELHDALRDVVGYDGVEVTFEGTGEKFYVAWFDNQIKSLDPVTYDDNGNVIPLSQRFNTENNDIRYSLTAEGETPKKYGNFNIYAKDILLETAPVQEGIAENATPTEETVSKMEQVADEFAPITEEEANALQSEMVDTFDDADVPPEVEAPYYGESEAVTVDDPFENRDIKEVGNRSVKAYMYENPEVKPFFQAEANIMLGELQNTVRGERFYTQVDVPGEYGAESYGVWGGTSRQTTPDIAYLLDNGKGNGRGYTYQEIEDGLNAIIEDHGEENNACSKRIEFLLNDRLMNGYVDSLGVDIPADQDYINLLNEKQIIEYSEEARRSFFEVADEYAPPLDEDMAPVVESKAQTESVENIAPEPTYETKKKNEVKGQRTMFSEGKTAEILTEEPKADRRKRSAKSMLKNNVLDKGMVFEDLSLKTGNRELQARWNSIRYAEGKAQKFIGEGNEGVSSLNSIRDTVERSGKTEEFYNYLYHKHNVDRMSLEEKATPTIKALQGKFEKLKDSQIKAIAAKKITDKTTEKTARTIQEAREYLKALETKNKPVFGDSVTAEVSRETADKLEKANPEFKEYAKEVYDYMNYLREMLVDGGVISRETANLWSEMYPHYVPIRRAGDKGLNINVPLDSGKTGINAPIKGATGGNSDILPLFSTMGQRTIQTYKAIAKNRFGVELKNMLGTTIANEETSVDGAIESLDSPDELLQKGKNGKNPTFTVFENGERVTFEITDEMYDAIKPTGTGLSYTNTVANAVGRVFRGLLTEYNPVFMATNAVKDAQDVLINSQHAGKTYAAIPKAIKQMATKGHWYQEYLANGGEQNTYFDNNSSTFKAEDEGFKKLIGMPLRGISFLNNTIERIPRFAEYIASRESGRSVDVSMLDAARVTTNFAAGGDVTKFFNRNGFNFLNASMQGAVQQVRNVREAKANGLKGWMHLATKVAIAGIPALILNNLLWDDDEEYEELSDYVKDNYYIVAKYDDGKFVRIPKGRAVAVIQEAFEQMGNLATGNDEVDLNNFLELAISNLAPNNPLENNILAPIIQAKNNETWYGEDLVPTRLQDLPEAEQYDESTDSISKWLGEKLNISPYKLNYLLNQYSGGIGDVFLPMLTPEAESGDNSLLGNISAPFKDKFTTDSVMNNQNVSDFYDTVDELTANAKSSAATDKDVLMYKYMNSVNAELSELYKQKREIQNSDLDDAVKYEKVRALQSQIDALARESLNSYNTVRISDGYATVGGLYYRLNDDGEWQKLSDDQLEKQEEVTDGLGIDPSEYWDNKTEYDFAYEYPEKYAVAKSVGGYEKYKSYSSELYDIKADKDENGKSISGSRKEKVIDYINNLEDADYGERLILFKSEYNADDTYNYEIIDYLNSREDITYEEMETILKELGFTVKSDGTVTWD